MRSRTAHKFMLTLALLAVALPARAANIDRDGQIEPTAGTWRTWVIPSGQKLRVPPPPGRRETRAELTQLADLISQIGETDRQQITFWDAGAPAYRWIDLINARIFAGTPTTAFPHRVYTYVALAMYDATIATWESKYFYNRRRPSEVDGTLPTGLPVPNSPSYPSEHAAAAQAAATVLAYFLPAEGESFQRMAEQAGWSRVLAGLQYPSDYNAGLALGRAVAEQVIAKARQDGSDAVWMGTVPEGPCNWTTLPAMPIPGNVTAADPGWTTLLLESRSQFRPAAPPDCRSAEMQAQVAAVRTFPRTFVTNYKAFYWQSPEGIQTWPYRYADKWISEDRLDQNPPRAARTYALIAAVHFDAFIASQDGKFAYWYLRPHQLDPRITPLFPVPYFPSYPSNHAVFSSARAEVLAYLFPTRAAFIRDVGFEGGESRIWAGIHYQIDLDSGRQLGRSVAQVFIDWARSDGSQ